MSRAFKKDKDTQQNNCDLLSLGYCTDLYKQTKVRTNITELIILNIFAIFYDFQSVM